jgi:hypothetical protein
MAGFAPLLDTISFEIEDVSATASDVATCDIFVLTPQGQGNVTEWPSYDESELSFSSVPSGWSLSKADFMPYKTGDGKVRLVFNLIASVTDGTGLIQVTSDGTDFYDFQVVTYLPDDNTGTGTAYVNNSNIVVGRGSSSTGFTISGDVLLNSWPTWATKGGNIQLLDNNGLYQNAKGSFQSTSGSSIPTSAWTTIGFSQVVKDQTLGQWDGSTFTALRTGFLELSCAKEWANAFTVSHLIRIYKNGSTVLRQLKFGPNSASSVSTSISCSDIYLQQGESIEVQVFQQEGVNRSFTTTAANNWLDLNWQPDSTGNQATGAGTSSLANQNPQNVLVNYQAMTPKAADNQFTGGNISATRIGDTITVTSDVALTDPGDTSPATSVGFLPVDFRPSTEVSNLFFMTTTRVYMVRVKSDGQIECEYRDWAGGATAPSTSGRPITITYRV